MHVTICHVPLLGTGGMKAVTGAMQSTLSEESSLRLESALRRIVEEGVGHNGGGGEGRGR